MTDLEPDPRVLKLIRDVDRERRRRIAAEKSAVALRSVLTRLKREREQRTQDARPRLEHERPEG